MATAPDSPLPRRVIALEITRLALPALAAGAAEPLLSLIDTAIIGRTNESAMAGAAIASLLFHSLFWTVNFLPLGMSGNVAHLHGSGQHTRGLHLGLKTTLVGGMVGLCIAVAFMALRLPLYGFYHATEAVTREAAGYYLLRMAGMPLAMMNVCLAAYLQGVLDTRTPMVVLVSTAVVNAVLDWVLVLGIGGWPGMGVTGAGVATVLSQALALMLFLGGVLAHTRRVAGSAVPWPTWRELRAQPMKFVGGVGMDLFLRSVSLNLVFFVGMVLATRIGTAEAAAHNIVIQLWFFAAHTTDALAIAARSLTGAALGAGQPRRALRRGGVALWMGLAAGTAQTAFFVAVAPFIGRWFTHEATVLALLPLPYWIFALSQPMNAVSFVLDGVLKGAGDAAFLRTWLLVGSFLGFMPLALILTPQRGDLLGIWLGLVALMFSRTASIVVRFYSGKWTTVGARVYDLGTS